MTDEDNRANVMIRPAQPSSSGAAAMLPFPKAPFALFLTPKSPAAIPIRDGLHHDLLRQAALDATVKRIDYVGSVVVAGAPVDLDAIVITRGRDRYIVEAVGHDTAFRSLDDDGMYLLAARKLAATPLRLTSSEIRREPTASNARMVWDQHRRSVGLDRRLAIADALDRCGPMTIGEMACEMGRGARLDVFGLACEATLCLDIDGCIDDAIVSHRPAATGRGLPVGLEQHYGRRP